MKGDYVRGVNRFYTSFFVFTNEKIKSGVHEYDLCCSIFSCLCSVLYIVVCPVVIFVWPLYCLSFSDLWFLITPLVYSNFFDGFHVCTSQFDLGIKICTLNKRRFLLKLNVFLSLLITSIYT